MENKAFTLIELLVVVSIIVIITALTLPNYRLGDNQLAIQRSAHKASQDLRRAQEFAISVKELNGSVPNGYGVYFDLDQPDRYVMFADLNGDQVYSGLNEKAEEIILEGNVTLDSLTPVAADNSLNVFFAPPNPTISFLPNAATAIINIEVQGSSVSIPQYNYNYTGWVYGLLIPRAGCDISNVINDCPSSFSALATDPATVYDQSRAGTQSAQSAIYQKNTTQVLVPLSQTIQVNKAGLINVE